MHVYFSGFHAISISKPPPPVPGKITHHSIQLIWMEALDMATTELHGAIMGDARIRIRLEKKSVQGFSENWIQAYT